MQGLSTISGETETGDDRQPLSEKAHRALAEAIIRGSLPPGMRVSEAQLARHLGISRAPLREALRMLEEGGLLQRRPHASLRVTALQREQMIEMSVMREALEGMAARLAATRATEAELAELRGIVEEQAAGILAKPMAGGDADWRFHAAIARSSGNRQIHALLESDLYRLLRNHRHPDRLQTGRAARAVEEHRRILAAIEERDPELAELQMRRHIASARAILHASLVHPEGTCP